MLTPTHIWSQCSCWRDHTILITILTLKRSAFGYKKEKKDVFCFRLPTFNSFILEIWNENQPVLKGVFYSWWRQIPWIPIFIFNVKMKIKQSLIFLNCVLDGISRYQNLHCWPMRKQLESWNREQCWEQNPAYAISDLFSTFVTFFLFSPASA